MDAIEPEVRVYPNLEALSRATAEEIARLVRSAVAERGRFAVALSGGGTPRTLYGLLAERYSDRIPWPRVHFFWGDERYVPPDHPDSNFAMAFQTLLSKIPVPLENVHRILVEIPTPEEAARAYEQLLREFLRPSRGGEPSPSLDLILLGVGEDGHTASLFPGDPVLEEKERWVAAVCAPPPVSPDRRITLTLPAINGADRAFFLVSMPEKRGIVRSVLEDIGPASRRYPAAMVCPREELVWFIDRATMGE